MDEFLRETKLRFAVRGGLNPAPIPPSTFHTATVPLDELAREIYEAALADRDTGSPACNTVLVPWKRVGIDLPNVPDQEIPQKMFVCGQEIALVCTNKVETLVVIRVKGAADL